MRVRVDGRILEGRGIDVPGVTPEALVQAVQECSGISQELPETDGPARSREDHDPETAPLSSRHTDRPSPSGGVVSVEAPPPRAGHEPLMRVPLNCSLRRGLAAAGRSCGTQTSLDRDIARVEQSLERLDPPNVDLETARRQLATTGDREEQLRERVASLRGKLHARRKLDADTETLKTELTETAAKLSEAETERIAAEQALQRERDRARDARDIRDNRLELQDELANRRRSARAILAKQMYPAFVAALQRVPGEASPGHDPVGFDGDPIAADLATIRIAQLAAPTVLALEEARFADAAIAAEQLDARVLRVPPHCEDEVRGIDSGNPDSATRSNDNHSGPSS